MGFVSPARRRTALGASLLIVLVVAVAGLAWQAVRGPAAADPAAILARLVPWHRPLLARLTVEGAWAPRDPAAPKADPAALERAYGELLAAKVAGVPGARAALAAFYVVRGEAGDAERALVEAEDPLDRGAVLLALDRADEALEELARAIEARPADPRGLFDRALALEALLLDGQAKEAWAAYLAAAGEGPWAEEARSRVARLGQVPPGDQGLDLAKRDAVQELRKVRGPDGLAKIRPAAQLLAEAGDQLLVRSIAYLQQLDPEGWALRNEEIRRFDEVRRLVLQGRNMDAQLGPFERSADPLQAVSAIHFRAYGALLRGDSVTAADALARLREKCEVVGCVEEVALVASDLGNLHHLAGRTHAAMRAYEAGAAALPAGFSRRHAEILHKQAAVAHDQGATERANSLLAEAMRLQRRSGVPPGPRLVNFRASVLAVLGRRAAAEAFGREAIVLAEVAGEAAHELSVTADHAMRLADWGRLPEAAALFRRTIAGYRRTSLEPGLAVALGRWAELDVRLGELDEANAAADESLAIASRVDSPGARSFALAVKAQVARARGSLDEAVTAAREAVRIDDEVVAGIPDVLARRRVETSVARRRLLLAELLGESRDVAGAVRAFAGGRLPPLRSGECRLGIGHLDDHLLVFSAHEGGERFERTRVPREELRAAMRGAWQGELGPLAARLGSFWSASRCPDSAVRVALVEPPGALAAPLPGLVVRERPGTLVGVASSPGSRWPDVVSAGPAWIVRDPLVSPDAALPRLPGSARELGVLRSFRPDARELRGSDATPARVREVSRGATLIHFAVHAVSRTGSGPSSYLLLAGDQGRLEVADILHLDLAGSRPLVLLSACRSAGTPENLEHDGAGLAWAFLQAGASAVIAPLEAVADDDAGHFSAEFYRALTDGAAVPQAVDSGARACHPGRTCGSFVLYF